MADCICLSLLNIIFLVDNYTNRFIYTAEQFNATERFTCVMHFTLLQQYTRWWMRHVDVKQYKNNIKTYFCVTFIKYKKSEYIYPWKDVKLAHS